MDKLQDFRSLQDNIQTALIATTRTSGQIASEDLGFQRSLNSEIGTSLDEQSARLLELSSKLLKSAASLAELTVPVLEELEDVDNNWRNVVDVVDSLLEKADTCLDEYTGVIKRRDTPNTSSFETTAKSRTTKHTSSLGNTFRTQNLVKPQLAFNIKPDNDDTSPWKPILDTKPHAIVPLEESLSIFKNDFDQLQYKHPYEMEILQLQYPATIYQKTEPVSYLPIETTSATFVATLDGVMDMLEELKTATEIAVDLEHHDARSYVGLVSLMQISTRNKDWIVDTLKPWRQELQVLNKVFADPNIVKVFHGAYMDIMWLQRDLGLYVVGLFDTHWASRTLGYQGGSLAFLLKKFIDFDADKKYQLADWRIRPIPDEMFFYARADTHYLLYIYDNMRNELIEKSNLDIPDENKLEVVLQKSKETSLIRFERQVYNEDTGKGPGGWYQLLAKTPALFNNEQFEVFRSIHSWRDRIAREDDDSTNFVMPNHVIFNIAKLMPMDMVALLGIAHPISHSVKSRTGELLEIIKSAKARGKDGPSMMDVLRPDTVRTIAKASIPLIAAEAVPPAATLVAVVNEEELRSEQSSFWGGAFGSSIWDTPAASTTDDSLRLAVPLPALSSEIFATANRLTDRSRVHAAAESLVPATQSHTSVKEADEPFLIKQGSNKRKGNDVSNDEENAAESEIDLTSLTNEEQEKAAQKAQSKREKRERKRQRKLAKAQAETQATAGNDSEDDEDEEPFDYSKAQSILHGKRNVGDQNGSKHRKKPFDPYAKSADAPKGMRRLQTERPGKSHTFKS